MYNKSIYNIETSKHVIDNIKEMKTIMIKGIGYFCIQKTATITPEIFLNLATSMERQGIKEV
jgi:hypothetical protein